MKTTITILLIFIYTFANSQTEQLEKESLSKRFNNGEFSAETYRQYGSEWQELINEFGGYPELPYDEESQQIRFKNLAETGLPKKINYNRILEWAAINFGSLNKVLHYKDLESGKIVIKGWFDVTHKNEYKNFWGKSKEGITTTKCYQTFIFTIKDFKIKTEVVDVRYEFKTHGYYSTNYYVPDRTLDVSIHKLYPITNFDSNEWNEKLDLLKQTDNSILVLMSNLEDYISKYDKDYNF